MMPRNARKRANAAPRTRSFFASRAHARRGLSRSAKALKSCTAKTFVDRFLRIAWLHAGGRYGSAASGLRKGSDFQFAQQSPLRAVQFTVGVAQFLDAAHGEVRGRDIGDEADRQA